MNLSDLLIKVTNKWTFNDRNYPILSRVPLSWFRHFAINHIIQHEIKAVNRVVRLLEDDEHLVYNSHIPIKYKHKEEVLEAIWRMQVNILKLADVCGITTEEIEDKILEWESTD